jgi:hypothetical protein
MPIESARGAILGVSQTGLKDGSPVPHEVTGLQALGDLLESQIRNVNPKPHRGQARLRWNSGIMVAIVSLSNRDYRLEV